VTVGAILALAFVAAVVGFQLRRSYHRFLRWIDYRDARYARLARRRRR
jgi:hypothetical protein